MAPYGPETRSSHSRRVDTTLNSVGLSRDRKDQSCYRLSRDIGLGGRRDLPFVESVEGDCGLEEGDVEIYVWNERLATYVLLPEDEGVADEVEGRIGAEHPCRTSVHHPSFSDRLIPYNTRDLSVDHVLSLGDVPDEIISSPSDLLPPSEQLPSPLLLNLSSLQPNTLPVILEETRYWQRVDDGNRDIFSASSRVPSSPCSMVSGFTYTSPQAAWTPSDAADTVGLDLEMEAQNIDSLINAGYNRSLLEGLHNTSRRLTRGIDTSTRKLLGHIRRLLRLH